MLAAFVFFSANTVHMIERTDGALWASEDRRFHFNFADIPKGGPRINGKAAIAVNYENGDVVYSRNCDEPRPIASISKLVTAMVLLDSETDLDQLVTVSRDDAFQSSRSRLRAGYQLSLRDLLHEALLASDNRAARAIARTVADSYEEFGRLMNVKAKKLGLRHTHFEEPTGLDERNVSTAHEVAKIVHHAFEYDLIRQITAKKRHTVTIHGKRRRQLQVGNTNNLIHSPYRVLTGKTGYIFESQYCLATLVENAAGERLTVVVLGVPGDNLRFREARRIMEWGFRQIPRSPSTS
jgi:D-alanyl-D-alanine endopeptidase (penicillin-binding protein 7)